MGRGRTLDVVVAGALLTALVLSYITDFGPNNDLQILGLSLGDACLFRRCTHIDCPFCGISRSMVAVMHGRIVESFVYHPLGPCLAVLFLGFLAAVCVAAYRNRTPIIETRIFSALILVVIITSLSLWSLRGPLAFHCPEQLNNMVPK